MSAIDTAFALLGGLVVFGFSYQFGLSFGLGLMTAILIMVIVDETSRP